MEGLKAEVRLLDLLKTFFPDTLGGASLLVIKPTELLGDIESEKRVVLDTLAFIDEKTRALIEMQRALMEHFAERSILYACRLVSKSLNRGDEYDLPNVLALFITEKPLPVFEGFDGFFIGQYHRHIIITGLLQNLFCCSFHDSDISERCQRYHSYIGRCIFFFHINNDDTFFLSCFADRTGKRCSAIAYGIAADFHRFMDMTESRIIKRLYDGR